MCLYMDDIQEAALHDRKERTTNPTKMRHENCSIIAVDCNHRILLLTEHTNHEHFVVEFSYGLRNLLAPLDSSLFANVGKVHDVVEATFCRQLVQICHNHAAIVSHDSVKPWQSSYTTQLM